MKPSLLLFFILLVLSSCVDQKPITNRADYEVYLTTARTAGYAFEEDIQFWNDRLGRRPGDEASIAKLAGLYSLRFRKTGQAEDIQLSDSLFQLMHKNNPGAPGPLLSLAQNAITQHQFKTARRYAEQALATGDRKAAALLVLTDVALELGDVGSAKTLLKQFTNQNSFAHLIRQVKVADHEGKQDSAIAKMERAYTRIKGNKTLACWAKSNLADMYGHAGKVEEAYRAYLDVLQEDPSYDYALKGIAWIALSNDHNFAEAKNIIRVLSSRSRLPEAHLMLAEIATEERNELAKNEHMERFVELTDQPAYQTMYAKYLALYYAEGTDVQKALAIAENEIRNRPNPQSYDLLAWAQLQNGQKEEALLTAQQHVEGHTFEPDAAYHLGMIYLANNLKDEAKQYLRQAQESSFELGPVMAKKINLALNDLILF